MQPAMPNPLSRLVDAFTVGIGRLLTSDSNLSAGAERESDPAGPQGAPAGPFLDYTSARARQWACDVEELNRQILDAARAVAISVWRALQEGDAVDAAIVRAEMKRVRALATGVDGEWQRSWVAGHLDLFEERITAVVGRAALSSMDADDLRSRLGGAYADLVGGLRLERSSAGGYRFRRSLFDEVIRARAVVD